MLRLNADRIFSHVRFSGSTATRLFAPKGLAFNPVTNRLIVSLTPLDGNLYPDKDGHDDDKILLAQVEPDGTFLKLAPDLDEHLNQNAGELKLAIVPLNGPPVEQAGFTPGDMFVAIEHRHV